jgi:hypothetical protein
VRPHKGNERQSMTFLIDHAAKELALRHFVVPECLLVPIAAVDEDAFRNYIGDIQQELGRGSPPRALVVRIKESPPDNSGKRLESN